MTTLQNIITNTTNANRPREEAITLITALASSSKQVDIDFHDFAKAASAMPGPGGFAFKVIAGISSVGGAPLILLILAAGVFQVTQTAFSLGSWIASKGASFFGSILRGGLSFLSPGVGMVAGMLKSDECCRDEAICQDGLDGGDIAELLTSSFATLPTAFGLLVRQVGKAGPSSSPVLSAPGAQASTNPLARLGASLFGDTELDGIDENALVRAAASLGVDPRELSAAYADEMSNDGTELDEGEMDNEGESDAR